MNIRIGSGQQELRIFSTASLRVFHDLIILKIPREFFIFFLSLFLVSSRHMFMLDVCR
jgi:hypothetical protein